jgi:crooked neck
VSLLAFETGRRKTRARATKKKPLTLSHKTHNPNNPPKTNTKTKHSVRTLYEKYLEWDPSNADAWLAFAELEAALGEHERARALFELAVGQPVLDAPERVWRAYVEFECARRERERARVLYERLLDRTRHVKVWLSFARFEQEPLPAEEEEEEDEGEGGGDEERRRRQQQQQQQQQQEQEQDPDDDESMAPAACERRLARARAVFERGFKSLREHDPEAKQEAVLLLDAWRAAETGAAREWGRSQADVAAAVAAVDAKAPRRVKRKRPAAAAGGAGPAFEEYWDLAFPDEQGAGGAGGGPSLKLLEAAQRWKRQRQEQQEREAREREGGGGGG